MMQKLRIWSMAAKISRKKRIAETENVILCLPNKIMPLQLVIFGRCSILEMRQDDYLLTSIINL
jgi:hypothetical protein